MSHYRNKMCSYKTEPDKMHHLLSLQTQFSPVFVYRTALKRQERLLDFEMCPFLLCVTVSKVQKKINTEESLISSLVL